MKQVIVFAVAALLIGCAEKPYEASSTIYSSAFAQKSSSKTKVRVHREQQLTGSALGESCPLVLKVDDVEVARLQQNQYVDLYLADGLHDLSVRFACAATAWRKSITIIADGKDQEINTEQGAAGQYRMWRVK